MKSFDLTWHLLNLGTTKRVKCFWSILKRVFSANGRFAALDQTINCISNTVNSVTKVVVPNSSVCPGWGPTCTHAIPCPTTAAPAAPAA